MLVAYNENGDRCYAKHTERSENPFFCPECNKEVLLKKGEIREHHFAHKPPVDCLYGQGETQEHYAAKNAIYDALFNHSQCRKCAIERRLKGVRPDISLYIRNIPVAIEFQRSSTSTEIINQRMNRYRDLGIHVVWLIPHRLPNENAVIRTKVWERYLHTLFYGRCYFWIEKAIVLPVHFNSHKIIVPSAEWYEDGEEMYVDGYSYYAKEQRKVLHGRGAHLANDFKKTWRDVFQDKKFSYPSCLLWMDAQNRWW
jgi:competence protein CoiA